MYRWDATFEDKIRKTVMKAATTFFLLFLNVNLRIS